MSTFKEKMLSEYIPAVERLLQNEKDHLQSMEKFKEKITKRRFFFFRKRVTKTVDECIESSKNRVFYYEEALKKYVDYTNKLEA